MLCNIHSYLVNNTKNIKSKKIKPLYIPPYQHIPIYNTCSYKIEPSQLIISEKLYNAIKNNSAFAIKENKKPKYTDVVPAQQHIVKMYV
jgi:hypothetical protein